MPISMAVDSNLVNQSASTEGAPAAKPEAKTSAAPAAKKDRAYFSTAIQTATIAFYRSGRAVADLLLEARLTLSPEEFQKFINEDCQFDSSLVYKFCKMAADFRLNDPANEALLPEAWTTRYEIMLMKESTFRIGVTTGIIHPDCKLDDLKKLREQIEGTKAKGGKGDGKKKAATKATPKAVAKDAPVVADVQPDSPTLPEAAEVRPVAQQAPLKAPVNSSVMKGVGTSTGVATAPEKGRIAIVLSRDVADRYSEQVEDLKNRIEELVKNFAFVGTVQVEVAA
jgi:hypothetical protein